MGLDLSKMVQNAISTVTSAVDGVEERITFNKHASAPVYEPATDSYSSEYASTTNIRSIWCRFKDVEFDVEKIRPTDYKVLIAALDLPGIEPSVEDQVILRGKTYGVYSAKKDPAKALWILQVRGD
jgi:hypothetical protein